MRQSFGLDSLPGTLDLSNREDACMSRSYDDGVDSAGKRRRHRRSERSRSRSLSREEHRRRGRHGEREGRDPREELGQLDESVLAPEERAYLEARRRAEQKVDLYREAVKIGIFALPLLIFVPWAAGVLFLFGCVKLGRKSYRIFVEPKLRERLVRDEVAKQVSYSVHQERRHLEGEHARSLEELSASIAHEIRNPITAAKSLVQQMGEEPDGSDNLEYARVAVGELERVEKSISHLLRFARDEELRMSAIRMSDVLDSALETFRDRSARSGVEIVRQFDCDGLMQGDAEKLRRIVINLVGNAIDALEESNVDKPRVEVSMGENLAGTEVWLRIRDNGLGIDPETRNKMFSPFFTSKQSGTGLGLAITKKLIEGHNGTIEVESEPGAGAEFVLSFPKRSSDASPGGTS